MRWIDETLKLRPAASGLPLRIGVWLEQLQGLPWMEETIRSLRATPGLELAAVFLREDAPAESAPPLLQRWYHRRNLQAAGGENPLRPVDLRPALEGITLQHQVAHAEALALDVMVYLGHRLPSCECAPLARYGLWSLGLGEPGGPLYFYELAGRTAVSSLLLYAHTGHTSHGRVLYQYQSATRCTWSSAVNAIEPLSMAPVILIRRLLDVQQAGTEASCWKGEIVPLPPRPSRANPSLWALLSLITVYLFRYAGRRLLALRGDAKWFVCYRPHRNAARFDAAGFRAVPNPPGASYADPFLFEHEGRTHLFVEEIVTATSRGHCSACEILPDGSLTPFTTVLQTPYHLSYPCVFKTNDGIFMIPETADRRTVQLHRAAPFPQQWPLEKVLFSDVLFVDTTPFFHEGVWYLFTGTVEEVSGQWLETWLFTADQLEGPWHYHPCNPICSDVRRARPAGHLFYRDGKLIRPGQDCTVRYGYALTLSHVVQLSPTTYEEKLEEVILPDWMPGIFATHTLNTGGGYEVIDATRLPS